MSRESRLAIVLAMNLILIGVLIAVGIAAHSVGVLAAGGDYLADAAAIAVSLLAIWMSRRPKPHPRATTVAALVNAAWLLALSVLVAAGAALRLATRTPKVDGLPVLVVSAAASVVMVVGAFILRRDIEDGDDDEGGRLNMRAVLLDTAADAAAAAGVAGTGGVILATGAWFWLDPAAALLIALVVGYHALSLVRKATGLLRVT